jgi:hypothetical protein
LITFVSTLYPSKKASRLNPAEALRNEWDNFDSRKYKQIL